MKKFLSTIMCILIFIGIVPTISYAIQNDASNIALPITTYRSGKNQPTHPSIYSFDKPWNSHKYWMAYTPYPDSNGAEENPSIAVSDDLLNWSTPNGLFNPIANCNETNCDEYKDPHIVYN